MHRSDRTSGSFADTPIWGNVSLIGTFVPSLAWPSRANPSRGGDAKPGISPETARLPTTECIEPSSKGVHVVKANLARFTWALTLLASLALTVGAGMRWN
jgi:hypothetical protein